MATIGSNLTADPCHRVQGSVWKNQLLLRQCDESVRILTDLKGPARQMECVELHLYTRTPTCTHSTHFKSIFHPYGTGFSDRPVLPELIIFLINTTISVVICHMQVHVRGLKANKLQAESMILVSFGGAIYCVYMHVCLYRNEFHKHFSLFRCLSSVIRR